MSFPDPYSQPYEKPSDAVPYYQPEAYPQQQQPGPTPSYPYPLQQQPGAAPAYPYPPQQQPGAAPVYPQRGPYPQQGAYPPAMPYGPYNVNMVQGNPRATRAMIYSFIAIALSVITFLAALGGAVGLGGIITGIFSVIYGFQGLNWSKRLPNNAGRGKSLTAIIVGFIALTIVVIAFLIDLGKGTI